jgi:hypothetical protein
MNHNNFFEKNQFKIFAFIFVFLLLQRPFGYFEFSNIRLVKYLLFFIIILFLLYFIIKNYIKLEKYIIPPEIFVFLMLIIYDSVNLRPYTITFFLQTLIIFIYSVWLQFQSRFNIEKLLAIYIYLSFFIAIHGIFQHLYVYQTIIDIHLQPYPEYSLPTPFNIYFGSINSIDNESLRIASFFTEANRLAYFLVPSALLFFCINIKHKKIIGSIIFLGIILTFSFYGILIFLISSLAIKNYRKYIFLIIFLLAILLITIYLNNPDLLNKSASYASRIESLKNLYQILENYPAGMTNVEIEKSTIEPTDTLLLHYAIRNGYFGLLFIFTISLIILMRCTLLIKTNDPLNLAISGGIFAILLYQFLMGNLFEFQFLLYCIISHAAILNSHIFRK